MAGAVAVHTSLSPNWALLRLRSFQVSPAPETVALWPPAVMGPSVATNATSVSSGTAVLRAGVLTAPRPWTDFWAWRTKQVIGGAGFCTVTASGAAVVIMPDESVALADSVWVPAPDPVVS